MRYRDHVERVRAATDLEAVLRTRYQITVEDHKALCPFHADSHPSLNSTDRHFHCFACQAGGDVFRFVERKEAIPFPAAVDLVGSWAGIAPYQQTAADRAALILERQAEDITEWAGLYYTQRMTAAARDYLQGQRGLPAAVIEAARCGWADGGLVEGIIRAGGTADMAIHAGLAAVRPNQATWTDAGAPADWLRDRIVFPSLVQGRAAFLSGRTMTAGVEPKYLHQRGRQAPLYNEAALASGRVFVTEGQIDTLSLLAWDLPAVGLLGTPHASHLAALRQAKMLYLCLDADAAGQRGALKLAATLGPGHVQVVTLPEGMDPNDVYRAHTKSEFLTWFDQARDPVAVVLDALPFPVPDAAALLPLFALLVACDPMEQYAYLTGPVKAWAKGERRALKAVEAAWQAYQAGPQTCATCGAPVKR